MSVYKDNVRGTWYFRIRKTKIDGEIKEVKRRGFKTKGEAKDYEAKELLKTLESTHAITFFELYQQYYAYAKTRLKERSLNTNNSKIQLHILPYFKDKKIDKITTKDILKWQEEISQKNYAHSYKSILHTLFSTIMTYAMKYNGLKQNPLPLVGNFKDPNSVKKEMQFFTKDEFDLFIEKETDIVYKTFFIILYYSGLRLGEALALNWNDFKKDTLSIKKSLSNKVNGKVYAITSPKTKNSVRDILLPNHAIVALTILRAYYEVADGFNKEWFIFGGIRPLAETTIRNHKIAACKKAGVKEIRIHDFRGSHASLLINLGADILYISKRLGHSNIAETLNTYSHLYPNKQKEIVDLLNKL